MIFLLSCFFPCGIYVFFPLAAPCSMWDLSSLTGTKTVIPEVEAQSPNHWTAREFPVLNFRLYFCLFI